MANSSKVIRWGFANGGNTSLFDYNEFDVIPGNYFINCGSPGVVGSCVNNFRLSNAEFISGSYCELLGITPNISDFNFLLNGLNNNSITKTDVINSLTTYQEFIDRYDVLNLYYTYGVTPPPKAQFLSSIMPIANSNKSVLSTIDLICNGSCAGTPCPESNLGYGATVGHQQIANNIFNSAQFVNRYGTTVKNYSNTDFLSWVMKQNDAGGNSSAVGSYYFPGSSAAAMLTEMTNRGASAKPFVMAYYTRLHEVLTAAGCANCGGLVSTSYDYYGASVKFRRHMNAVVIQYLLRDIWINTRTNWANAKNANYLFSLPGGCDAVNLNTLDNNFKNYVTTGILPNDDWGSSCCFGETTATTPSDTIVVDFVPETSPISSGVPTGPILPSGLNNDLIGFTNC